MFNHNLNTTKEKTNSKKMKTATRSPRFRRVPTSIGEVEKIDSDLDILEKIYHLQHATIPQISALTERRYMIVGERMKKLYHNGYIYRFKTYNNTPIVHAIENQGYDCLIRKRNYPPNPTSFNKRNRRNKPFFIQHQNSVANFGACLEVATKKNQNTQLEKLEMRNIKNYSFKTQQKKLKITTIPDAFFSIQHINQRKEKTTSNFFVEIDRGTESINPKKINNRSTIAKKMTGYWKAHKQGLFKEKFNLSNARILFITTSDQRIDNMIALNKEIDDLKKGSRLFYFTTLENFDLKNTDKVLDKIWRNGRDDEKLSLIE